MDSPISRDGLALLAAFAAVADERSFTKAAVKLGVSRSAISHSIRTLEERLGLRLLARTTRTVAPTNAGDRLLAQLRPALRDIRAALTEAGQLRAKPAGTIRLIAPPIAVATVVSPRLASFTRNFPEVVLDITAEDNYGRDLVAGNFDAGIHLGEFVQRDMVAVRVTGEQRAAIVAAGSDGAPLSPVSHGRQRVGLPMGVREARQAGHGIRVRAAHLQRRRTDAPSCAGRSGTGLRARGARDR